MIIKDRVYGECEVTEPVLLKLMEHPAITRVKGCCQAGNLFEWTKFNKFSRYEHCVGTMLLVRMLGASVSEQVAALAHDASHPAFSHTWDRVHGDPSKESHQDSVHAKYIKGSGMLSLVREFGLKHECLLSPDSFSLLERPAPELCADRVDYTLRQLALDKPVLAEELAGALQNQDGKIVFSNKGAAVGFWRVYTGFYENCWSNPVEHANRTLLADAIRQGLKIGVLDDSDAFTTDKEVMDKLKDSTDRIIRKKLSMLPYNFSIVLGEGEPLKWKFRYVNPAFVENDKVKKVSDVSKEFKDWFAKAKAEHSKELKLKIVEKKSVKPT